MSSSSPLPLTVDDLLNSTAVAQYLKSQFQQNPNFLLEAAESKAKRDRGLTPVALELLKANRHLPLRHWSILQKLSQPPSKQTTNTYGLSDHFMRHAQNISATLNTFTLQLPYHDHATSLELISKVENSITRVLSGRSRYNQFISEAEQGMQTRRKPTNVLRFLRYDADRAVAHDPSQSICSTPALAHLIRATGARVPLLRIIDRFNVLDISTPGENGYTKVFNGGHHYSVEELRAAFNYRNDTDDTLDDPDVITISISYKHMAVAPQTSQRSDRISTEDLICIARFLQLSPATKIRFWIDTKLPATSDGSFERWLRRGVTPYCRYATLVCPSAERDSVQDRFWLRCERTLAHSHAGVFNYTEGGEVWYSKRFVEHHRVAELDRMLLEILLQREVPPGVRKEDRKKVVQWALASLGVEKEGGLQEGLIVDSMGSQSFDEFHAFYRIEKAVRASGDKGVTCGQNFAWNPENPLVKKEYQEPGMYLSEWIGFASEDNKCLVFFVHVHGLGDLNGETVMVLKVRLWYPYDKRGRVSNLRVREKRLEIRKSEELLGMRAVSTAMTGW